MQMPAFFGEGHVNLRWTLPKNRATILGARGSHT